MLQHITVVFLIIISNLYMEDMIELCLHLFYTCNNIFNIQTSLASH